MRFPAGKFAHKNLMVPCCALWQDQILWLIPKKLFLSVKKSLHRLCPWSDDNLVQRHIACLGDGMKNRLGHIIGL